MKKTWRKLSVILLAGMLSFASAAVPVCAGEEGDPEFDEFLMELFVEMMESDFMNMHFTVRDYESFGIERPEADIGTIDLTAGEDSAEYLETLHSFDRSKLSKEQQRDYDILERDLQEDITLAKYPDYEMLFDPVSGLTDNLITTFTEFVFYSKEDVEDYLTILSQVPRYIDEALEVTKDQASRGHFLTDSALDDVQEAVARFTEKKNDNELIVDFEKDVSELSFLSEKEKQEFCEKNRDIVLNAYIPSYEKASAELEKLRGSRSVSGGLCQYPDGEEYYRAYAASKASTSKSAEELISLMKQTCIDAIMEYVYTNGGGSEEDSVKFDSAEETLKYLTEHLGDYPEGCETDFTVSYLDPSIANPNIVAYYLTPCLDTPKVNVIRVNGGAVDDKNDLYMTLAHEGFPGHQYQITWYMNTNPAPARSILSHGGYTEGWAMYAEINALSESTLKQQSITELSTFTTIGYIVPCIVDLGVNVLGWSANDVRNLMEELYLNTEIAGDYYDEAVNMPGRLLNYGCGLAQFMNIRSAALAQMDEGFDLVEFNRVLLTGGDRPFDMVEEDVREWVMDASGREVDYTVPENSGMVLPDEMEQHNTMTGIYVICGLLAIGIITVLYLRRAKKKNIFAG